MSSAAFLETELLRPDIFTLLGFFPVLIVTNTQRTRPQTFVKSYGKSVRELK